jgi:catechol 2,3-dioxygenase-like lactoylglutathione lyase family enzyme
MEPRVNFITLGTADLAAARRFYVDGLGWQPVFEVPDEVVFIQVGPALLLSLWKADALDADIGDGSRSSEAPAPFSLAHNVSSDAEVVAVIDRARAARATILKEPVLVFFGGFQGYFADPSGFRWEIAHNPGWSVDADGTVHIGPIEES